MKVTTKAEFRTRRHLRLRKSVIGSAQRPRMSVYVSGRHMYVQFIDDAASRTLAAASTQSEGLKGARANVEAAKKLGAMAAEAAKAKGIQAVVFDRGGFAYSGRIKVLADAARAAGLQF
jgi:large subunit ribosomal protein L18